MESERENTAPADLPPELARIQAEAAALMPPEAAANDPAADPAAAPAVIDYDMEAKYLVDMGAEMLSMAGPKTAAALDADRRARFAGACAGLMRYYGVGFGGIMEKYGPHINFAFACVTIGPPVARAFVEDRAAAKAADAPHVAADPQPPRPVGDPYQRFAEQQAA